MKVFKNFAVVFAIFLFFVAVLSCEKGEESRKVDLDKRVSDVSQLVKTTDMGKSLTFCFDRRIDPSEEIKIYGVFLDYLEKETGLDFTLLFSKSYQEAIENIGAGKAQFAIMGGLSFLKAQHDYGVRMLVKGLGQNKKGDYQAAIIVEKNSPIKQLCQLKGCCFAFGSKHSTQGYLIPRYMLEKEGVLLGDLNKYFFTGSHWNCARAVIKGDALAGGIQDALAFRLEKDGVIRIIALSDYHPRSGIAVNKNVPEEIVDKVKTALLRFDPAGKHKDGLINWDKTEMLGGFTDFKPQNYDVLKKIAEKYRLLGDS
ncbi:MAG: phosphate/phosphite/phosphonate ABC transporter substrate-binding protein [Desulfobacteraceae bacterium]|nr:phosphate/phosphite/phosphonate ABC transporter substrate-binding protein [Desulfobacteraceae bacterium]MBC2719620.1 phosphate/phosphite/phosphonate ABC transporter substrate-binding protein [Desulfobacteraceae bacterium]